MADLSLGGAGVTPVGGFVDKRRGRGSTGADSVAEIANMMTVSTLRARLTALAAASYPASRLNSMTRNDMVMALRLASADSAGIK